MSNLLQLIVQEMDKHHATNIQALDFRNYSANYDYFVIGSAQNNRLAWALIEYLKEALDRNGFFVRSVEGDANSRWILMDCFDVVVHLFVAEEREVYQLDKLWGDLPHVLVER